MSLRQISVIARILGFYQIPVFRFDKAEVLNLGFLHPQGPMNAF